jgi:hypothetical protein
MKNIKDSVGVSDKILITIEEANAISNIGVNRLRELINDPTCPYVFYNGKKKLIKRKAFEKFLSENIEI